MAPVRGQVSLARKTRPGPRGTRSRYGSVLSVSGFRAINSSTPRSVPPHGSIDLAVLVSECIEQERDGQARYHQHSGQDSLDLVRLGQQLVRDHRQQGPTGERLDGAAGQPTGWIE